MIYIDRQRIPCPSSLNSRIIQEHNKKAADFFKIPLSKRSQIRYDLVGNWMKVRGELVPSLKTLFHGKCAYCEVRPLGADSEVDCFRPRLGARGSDGESSPDHYWWLAIEWDNLYLCCPVCNKYKGTHFPVDGPRATAGASGRILRRERYLLIDPCHLHPNKYLVFEKDGRVLPLPWLQEEFNKDELGFLRARATIDILALNRKELIEARIRASQNAEAIWKSFLISTAPLSSSKRLLELINPAAEFCAQNRWSLARAMIATSRVDVMKGESLKITNILLSRLRQEIATLRKPKQRKVHTIPRGFEGAQRTAYVSRVEIENFRSISNMDLRLEQGNRGAPNWKVILGENATGKTSVLQAIALAMGGERALPVLKPLVVSPLRRGTRRGYIRVYLTAQTEPIELTFNNQRLEFTCHPEGGRTVLRGFGPARLAASGPQKPINPNLSLPVRVTNLFNAFEPICNPEAWLRGLSDDAFAIAARTIKDLLTIDASDDAILSRGSHGIQLKHRHVHAESLQELSEGYQSLFVLAADIMSGIAEKLSDSSYVSGVVLVDDLGIYLHPRWRMRIVSLLRTAFPNMQVIATTHDPLCLRGLHDHEVCVLNIDDGATRVREDLPPIAGLRVDQLLTSPFFGLNSTIDPEVDAKFCRYYQLLRKKAELGRLSQAEKDENASLAEELKAYNLLGATRRDQLVYEFIDEYLAEEQHLPDQARRQKLKTETKVKIMNLWRTYGHGTRLER